jgi:hypothetical protein
METHLPTPSCQGPWGKNLAWPEPFCGCRAHGFTLGRSQLAPAGGIGKNELEISQMMGTVYIYINYINYIYIYRCIYVGKEHPRNFPNGLCNIIYVWSVTFIVILLDFWSSAKLGVESAVMKAGIVPKLRSIPVTSSYIQLHYKYTRTLRGHSNYIQMYVCIYIHVKYKQWIPNIVRN